MALIAGFSKTELERLSRREPFRKYEPRSERFKTMSDAERAEAGEALVAAIKNEDLKGVRDALYAGADPHYVSVSGEAVDLLRYQCKEKKIFEIIFWRIFAGPNADLPG